MNRHRARAAGGATGVVLRPETKHGLSYAEEAEALYDTHGGGPGYSSPSLMAIASDTRPDDRRILNPTRLPSDNGKDYPQAYGYRDPEKLRIIGQTGYEIPGVNMAGSGSETHFLPSRNSGQQFNNNIGAMIKTIPYWRMGFQHTPLSEEDVQSMAFGSESATENMLSYDEASRFALPYFLGFHNAQTIKELPFGTVPDIMGFPIAPPAQPPGSNGIVIDDGTNEDPQVGLGAPGTGINVFENDVEGQPPYNARPNMWGLRGSITPANRPMGRVGLFSGSGPSGRRPSPLSQFQTPTGSSPQQQVLSSGPYPPPPPQPPQPPPLPHLANLTRTPPAPPKYPGILFDPAVLNHLRGSPDARTTPIQAPPLYTHKPTPDSSGSADSGSYSPGEPLSSANSTPYHPVPPPPPTIPEEEVDDDDLPHGPVPLGPTMHQPPGSSDDLPNDALATEMTQTQDARSRASQESQTDDDMIPVSQANRMLREFKTMIDRQLDAHIRDITEAQEQKMRELSIEVDMVTKRFQEELEAARRETSDAKEHAKKQIDILTETLTELDRLDKQNIDLLAAVELHMAQIQRLTEERIQREDDNERERVESTKRIDTANQHASESEKRAAESSEQLLETRRTLDERTTELLHAKRELQVLRETAARAVERTQELLQQLDDKNGADPDESFQSQNAHHEEVLRDKQAQLDVELAKRLEAVKAHADAERQLQEYRLHSEDKFSRQRDLFNEVTDERDRLRKQREQYEKDASAAMTEKDTRVLEMEGQLMEARNALQRLREEHDGDATRNSTTAAVHEQQLKALQQTVTDLREELRQKTLEADTTALELRQQLTSAHIAREQAENAAQKSAQEQAHNDTIRQNSGTALEELADQKQPDDIPAAPPLATGIPDPAKPGSEAPAKSYGATGLDKPPEHTDSRTLAEIIQTVISSPNQRGYYIRASGIVAMATGVLTPHVADTSITYTLDTSVTWSIQYPRLPVNFDLMRILLMAAIPNRRRGILLTPEDLNENPLLNRMFGHLPMDDRFGHLTLTIGDARDIFVRTDITALEAIDQREDSPLPPVRPPSGRQQTPPPQAPAPAQEAPKTPLPSTLDKTPLPSIPKTPIPAKESKEPLTPPPEETHETGFDEPPTPEQTTTMNAATEGVKLTEMQRNVSLSRLQYPVAAGSERQLNFNIENPSTRQLPSPLYLYVFSSEILLMTPGRDSWHLVYPIEDDGGLSCTTLDLNSGPVANLPIIARSPPSAVLILSLIEGGIIHGVIGNPKFTRAVTNDEGTPQPVLKIGRTIPLLCSFQDQKLPDTLRYANLWKPIYKEYISSMLNTFQTGREAGRQEYTQAQNSVFARNLEALEKFNSDYEQPGSMQGKGLRIARNSALRSPAFQQQVANGGVGPFDVVRDTQRYMKAGGFFDGFISTVKSHAKNLARTGFDLIKEHKHSIANALKPYAQRMIDSSPTASALQKAFHKVHKAPFTLSSVPVYREAAVDAMNALFGGGLNQYRLPETASETLPQATEAFKNFDTQNPKFVYDFNAALEKLPTFDLASESSYKPLIITPDMVLTDQELASLDEDGMDSSTAIMNVSTRRTVELAGLIASTTGAEGEMDVTGIGGRFRDKQRTARLQICQGAVGLSSMEGLELLDRKRDEMDGSKTYDELKYKIKGANYQGMGWMQQRTGIIAQEHAYNGKEAQPYSADISRDDIIRATNEELAQSNYQNENGEAPLQPLFNEFARGDMLLDEQAVEDKLLNAMTEYQEEQELRIATGLTAFVEGFKQGSSLFNLALTNTSFFIDTGLLLPVPRLVDLVQPTQVLIAELIEAPELLDTILNYAKDEPEFAIQSFKNVMNSTLFWQRHLLPLFLGQDSFHGRMINFLSETIAYAFFQCMKDLLFHMKLTPEMYRRLAFDLPSNYNLSVLFQKAQNTMKVLAQSEVVDTTRYKPKFTPLGGFPKGNPDADDGAGSSALDKARLRYEINSNIQNVSGLRPYSDRLDFQAAKDIQLHLAMCEQYGGGVYSHTAPHKPMGIVPSFDPRGFSKIFPSQMGLYLPPVPLPPKMGQFMLPEPTRPARGRVVQTGVNNNNLSNAPAPRPLVTMQAALLNPGYSALARTVARDALEQSDPLSPDNEYKYKRRQRLHEPRGRDLGIAQGRHIYSRLRGGDLTTHSNVDSVATATAAAGSATAANHAQSVEPGEMALNAASTLFGVASGDDSHIDAEHPGESLMGSIAGPVGATVGGLGDSIASLFVPGWGNSVNRWDRPEVRQGLQHDVQVVMQRERQSEMERDEDAGNLQSSKRRKLTGGSMQTIMDSLDRQRDWNDAHPNDMENETNDREERNITDKEDYVDKRGTKQLKQFYAAHRAELQAEARKDADGDPTPLLSAGAFDSFFRHERRGMVRDPKLANAGVSDAQADKWLSNPDSVHSALKRHGHRLDFKRVLRSTHPYPNGHPRLTIELTPLKTGVLPVSGASKVLDVMKKTCK